MELPDHSIGVTDVLAYRDCARRMAFGMRRHTEEGEHPQATSPSNAYGSAFHDAVAYIASNDTTEEEAIQEVMSGRFGRWIAPDDLLRLKLDLETYRSREFSNVETIAVEDEFRVPLMRYDGELYYYRFRIDRLYRSEKDPGTFIHVDFKTSRHPKSEADVHSDIQFSAYAMGIREQFPEIERLIQVYDQLNFGQVTTSRTDEQIELIREWLITNAIAILNDNEMVPTYNSYCAYCPVIMDCPIIPQLTDYALGEISGLMPREINGHLVSPNGEILTGAALEPYVEQLDKISQAKKVLEAFDGRVRGTLRELDVDERLRLGFKTSTPNVTAWPAESLQAIAGILGDDFWHMINLPKNAVERLPDELQNVINGMAVKYRGAPRMTRDRSANG